MKALTDTERKILDFIIKYQENNGDHPTYREILNYLELKSINSVSQYIKSLEKKGQLFKRGAKGYRLIKFL